MPTTMTKNRGSALSREIRILRLCHTLQQDTIISNHIIFPSTRSNISWPSSKKRPNYTTFTAKDSILMVTQMTINTLVKTFTQQHMPKTRAMLVTMEINTSLPWAMKGSTTFMVVAKTISKSLITISLRKTSRTSNKLIELYTRNSSRFCLSTVLMTTLKWLERWEHMTHLKLPYYSMMVFWEKEMKLVSQLSLPSARSWSRPLDLLFSRCLSELKSLESEATS